MTRIHAVVALLIGVVLPLTSRVFGSAELSYGMYAHAQEYRLDVFTSDAGGLRRRIAPASLARGARASMVPLFAGAEHWRNAPRIDDLRAALPTLAQHVCDREHVSTVEMTLEERAREGAPIRTTRAVAQCTR